MKVLRSFVSGTVLLANILVFGCLSCYAVPHSTMSCHEIGHHHSEECSACKITQRIWDVKLTNNQSKQEKYVKSSPQPQEDIVFSATVEPLLTVEDPVTLAWKTPDPLIERMIKTIVLRI